MKRPLLVLLSEAYPDTMREYLYAAILCGEIFVDGERVRDPKRSFENTASIRWNTEKYVGRGGYKLEAALDALNISPKGLICLDAGASTGGFTDCLLSRGARMVHAVDVGFNQLAWKLRTDSRVIVHEKTNLMDLVDGRLKPPPEFAVADLSFRSLRGAASLLLKLCSDGTVLSLVKPQFENPPEINFNGVVRSDGARRAAFLDLRTDLEGEGVFIQDAVASSITGRKGNAEIFVLLANNPPQHLHNVNERINLALAAADKISG